MEGARLTRREAVARAAAMAAALALPLPEIAAAARRRSRPPIHCLGASDRWAPFAALADCSDAAFSPDGAYLACTVPQGIEVRALDGSDSRLVAPPGHRLGGTPWHPDGSLLLVTGSGGRPGAVDAPFAARVDGSGLVPLGVELPGPARAACLSPDGRRVALTCLDGFLQRMLLADWQQGADPRLTAVRALLPFDPRTEEDIARMRHGLSWYETSGFTPDGRGLVFVSDRGGGMGNANVYVLDLESGRIRHVTRDDGAVEGAAVDSGGTLLYGSTRAREPAFMTLVSGPQVPPFLGFAATPMLRDALSHGGLPSGNGDVLAADVRTGLRARLVVKRETLARAAALGAPASAVRVRVAGVSRSGRELAVAVAGAGRDAVVLLRRTSGPEPVAPVETPVPPTASPLPAPREEGLVLFPEITQPISRTFRSRLGGSVDLRLEGTLEAGSFSARFEGFVDDVAGFDGPLSFARRDGVWSHEADIRRVRGSDAGEEDAASRGFYRADLVVSASGVRGSLEGRSSRSAAVKAVARDGALAPDGRWAPGGRAARGVPGAEPCRKRRRRRRPTRRRRRRSRGRR